ncbi:hypothetical protein NP493_73g00022 [Ridgeia piscesae]|uniref:Polypeptide N-acetylgalactosaminyltransferase n=1 Tax=Ridgeia piscesae TaxID=27915 RepID=A0AAD9UIK8_RIDPI|nr:hypothetical protein NP493_73g00022 [Ridgeia piscesae]
MRAEQLRKLQATIFLNPDRPPDRNYNINVTQSERIPLEREVLDSRPTACHTIRYDPSHDLTTTVIIPFYNEALSMLLRTVHSILRHTPDSLLEEIIIIDDHSPNHDLKEPLERYVKFLPKVKLLRTQKREGLIRVRLIGARLAKGKVLMFQDAHTENNVGWLEPLLEEFRKNPQTVIQPHVDQIDPDTIEYQASGSHVPRGGFTWDLRYVWMQMPTHEKRRLKSEADAHRSPTLVGCAIAVRKDYFHHIGGFDDAMNVWGGENIELAFRTWMCGGQVLTHPCSRVAHTFKPFAYSFDGDREKIVQKNLMRIAELWMDEWKDFFYASTWNWPSKRTSFDARDMASLERRRALKRKLKCAGFDWYMRTIVPEIPTPPRDATFYGEVTNLKTEACLYEMDDGFVGITYMCFFHRVVPENLFSIDTRHRLVHRGRCVKVDMSNFLLRFADCATEVDGYTWTVDKTREVEGSIKVTTKTDKGDTQEFCITQVTNINTVHYKEQMPQALPCDAGAEFQKWRFQYMFMFDHKFPLG